LERSNTPTGASAPYFSIQNEIIFDKTVDYNNEMTTYEDQSFRRERYTQKAKLMKLKDDALVILREALHAATVAAEATKVGDKKKVWKATYEAVIASTPDDVREITNFLRNHHGSRNIPNFER
jgi:hypothetical protein